ncbi:Parkin coregulated protein [Aphelenchoides bicaudatus]|nr:Parkin coregulated protein [Aphelenchoides bicaudatus]
MISYDVTRPCRNPRFRSWSPRFKVDCSRDIVKDNKRNQILYQKRIHSLRRVPGFTIQAEQKCTKPYTPATGFSRRQSSACDDENEKKFIKFYEDRQLPVRVVNSASKRNIEWLINPAELTVIESRDLLRKISCGLSSIKQPYDMIALRSFQDLISLNDAPIILAQALTDTIPNIRRGLSSTSTHKRMEILDLLRRITNMEGIGPLLVPFYRVLLPPLRQKMMASMISEDITTSETDRYNEAVLSTLHELEQTGGRHAFINIKYIIPDYQPVCIVN